MKQLEVEPGTTIDNAAFDAVLMANESGEAVQFVFNDKTLVATPGKGVVDLVNKYWSRCSQEREAGDLVRDAAPDLLEALQRLAMDRHSYNALGEDRDFCAACGLHYTSPVHYRAGESRQADLELAHAAIAKAKGASTP